MFTLHTPEQHWTSLTCYNDDHNKIHFILTNIKTIV